MTQDLDALPLPERPEARDMDYARFGYDADDMDFYGRACLIEGYELAMRKAQDGREPVAEVLVCRDGTIGGVEQFRKLPPGEALLYTSPPPKSDEARDAERWRMADLINRESNLHPDSRKHQVALSAYRDAFKSGLDFCAAIDAALAAQQKGGK